MLVMKRIADLLPEHGLDATPVRCWIDFVTRKAQLDSQQEELTEQRHDELAKECKFDSDQLGKVLNELWEKFAPITVERFAELTGLDKKHIARSVKLGKLKLTYDEVLRHQQKKQSRRSETNRMDRTARKLEAGRSVASRAKYSCTSCPWTGELKTDKFECPDCHKRVILSTGAGARK